MKPTSFIVEELRAIRDAGTDKFLMRRPREQDIPPGWEEEIARVQSTLRDVIRAVCQLSGVELPAPDTEGTDGQAVLPLQEGESFKDRIRRDLEAYSTHTVGEVMRQAEEQTRQAMGMLQNEFKMRVGLLAQELREGLLEQFRPEQVDVCISQDTRDRVAEVVDAQTDDFARWVWLCCKGKGKPVASEVEAMLEPYTVQAADKFLSSFGQQVQGLVNEQQQALTARLQGEGSMVHAQVEAMRQVSQEKLEQDAEAVRQKAVEHLNTVADELLKTVREQIGPDVEGIFGGFQQRLAEAVESAKQTVESENGTREDGFRQRLEAVAAEVKERSVADVASSIEETTANAIGPSVEHLHQQAGDALEHSREEIRCFMKLQAEEVRQQIEEMQETAHESLVKDTAQAVQNLQGVEQEIAEARERQMEMSQKQLTNGVMESLDSMTAQLRQIASEQMEEVNRYVREKQETAAGEYSERLRQATESCLEGVVGRIWQEANEAGAQASAEFRVNSRSVIQELSDQVDASREMLRRDTAEATARMESALQDNLENYRQQLTEVDEFGLKQQNEVMKGALKDLHTRLIRAANLLVPEAAEAPQPDVADAVA